MLTSIDPQFTKLERYGVKGRGLNAIRTGETALDDPAILPAPERPEGRFERVDQPVPGDLGFGIEVELGHPVVAGRRRRYNLADPVG